MRDPDKTFIKVNKALGKIPSIGPIPANQILPWISILIASWLVTMELFNLGLAVFFAMSLWLISTWWLLTGKRAYHFLDRFKSPPGHDWMTGYVRYLPLLHRPARCRNKCSARK
ncbi:MULTISPECIES: hypothetical protein [Leptolyngbya]|uniref:hypothetical protein n=1 Tax=Leptolyngbya TaxID=47251 RepID=UPI0016840E82|nr:MULTISPECIES: hypothetical protein [unclassified Leptolyngbya]MBD1855544.1 hypothetical protein [Leptolyngbya sp. FACHB-1624]MBN8563584.1 hypothetical protein [Leptolyngbya sp. UWPOB_LEPTO1]